VRTSQFVQNAFIAFALTVLLGQAQTVQATENCDVNFTFPTLEGTSLMADFQEIQDKLLGHSTLSLPSWKNPAAFASVLSENELNEVFSTLASYPNIPFEVPEQGCHARTTYMSYLMQGWGIKSVRFYMRGDLRVATKNAKECFAKWDYHVAPLVLMRTKSGQIQEMIIDPSLFNHPVPKDDWIRIATAHTSQAPTTYVRSGYYTGYDPLSPVQSERTTWDPDGINKSLIIMDEYMLVQERRRRQKDAGTFPICFNVR
jgi:hypothetical protein